MRVPQRHGQVAREILVQDRQVRRALDIGVAAQGHHAAARHPDVPQEELQHGQGTDVLDPVGVLREVQGIGDGARLVRRPGGAVQGGHLFELGLGDAADPLHHLGGIAGIVSPQELPDRVGVLERLVPLRIPLLVQLVPPGRPIVLPALRIVAGEQARQVAGGLELRVNQEGGVGVLHHVVVEVLLVADGVIDQPPEEHDVGP